MKGYVQIYTGNGKGKTTAALGLALRAAGSRMKVFIAQFIKADEYSEIQALKKLSDFITIRQFGHSFFINRDPDKKDIQFAQKGLKEVKKAIGSGFYQVIIMDEATIATHYNLFSVDDLIDLINTKPDDVELIITGRMADPRILEAADLVTEMVEIKHYYHAGVKARLGIEK